jgi:alpha-amylase/alpha-mannosidase (GH57 family)
MAVIYWAPLLHFYQPPLQLREVLAKVVNESYRPLLEVLEEYPHARVAVNINAVLTELLWEHGFEDVIERLKALAERGQVEFTGSAKYHAILPLIPQYEMRRQIRRNYLTNRHFFGDVYEPHGFFPPEMCYSPQVLEPVLDGGHRWLILSGVACPVSWPMNVVHQVSLDGDALPVLFRDDVLSNKISFQGIDGPGFVEHLRGLKGSAGKDRYVVTAMDAETFGHHIENWDRLFLAEVYESIQPEAGAYQDIQQAQPLAAGHRRLVTMPQEPSLGDVRMVTISELLNLFPTGQRVQPRSSSWSTTTDDLKAGNHYPLWKDPGNNLHRLQWEHTGIALGLVRSAQEVGDNETSLRHAQIARGLMDPALHSCQFWWASQRPYWDINMINRGLGQQEEAIVNAFRAINLSGAEEQVKRECYYRVVAARDIRDKIRDQLFWDRL